MNPALRLFKRAMATKVAFVPMPGGEPQAAGPGGMPVDPAAGGDPAAMGGDPAAMGGAPMDPAMGGAPMDPAMMDPAAMGMDPAMMDPAAMGMPPEDPAAGGGGLTPEDATTVDQITRRTMDIVRETLEIVGKAKPKEGGEADAGAEAAAAASPVEPMLPPGPISGMPADMSSVGIPGATGIPKLASVFKRVSAPKLSKTASIFAKVPTTKGAARFFSGK